MTQTVMTIGTMRTPLYPATIKRERDVPGRIMPVNSLRLIVLFVAWAASSVTLEAAEIRMDPSGGSVARAVFEGKIEAGDFEKVRNFLNHNDSVELYLASPGGNVGEALRIGFLTRLLKLSTIVPSKGMTNQEIGALATRHDLKDVKSDYKCASACFFIFVAGIHRGSDEQGPAILGIHEPYVTEDVRERLGSTQTIVAADETRLAITNYLKFMDVPAKYAEDMYSVPKGMIQWIRSDEFDSDFAGFIPELRSLVDAQCVSNDPKVTAGQSLMERAPEQKSTQETRAQCERKLQSDLAIVARHDVVAQHGGIPELRLARNPQSRPDMAGPANPPNSMPASSLGPAFPSSDRGPAFPRPAPPTVGGPASKAQ